MKKIYSLLIAGLCAGQLFAGGIVTNSNQSAQWVRMLSRNASQGIDAVYYNPAGVMKMQDGFYLALHNQTLFQEKTVVNNYSQLNNNTYIGDVSVPFFPNFYAVYKMNKLAFSLGFGPNGGGGSAKYDTGLPSFELPVSQLPLALSASGIPTSSYAADIKFEGSSVYLGAQFNVSFAITPDISIGAGLRYINATNKYKGHLRNIMINPQHPYNPNGAGNMVSAPLFFNTLAGAATAASTSLQQIIDAGGGSFTLEQLVGANMISAAQAAQLSGGLGAAYDPTWNVTTIQGAYQQQAARLTTQANGTADKEVDVVQTATGFTPIFGFDMSMLDKKLNVGVKYELQTSLEFTNDTKVDGTGLYPDGAKKNNDIPAILTVGVGYSLLENMRVSGSYSLYFDKGVDWGEKDSTVNKNLFEVGLGLEFDINKMITLSCGYLYGKTGVGQGYQTDISYSLNSSTVGFGGRINVNENLGVDLGVMYTMYTDGERTGATVSPIAGQPYVETYDKTNLGFAIGIGYKF